MNVTLCMRMARVLFPISLICLIILGFSYERREVFPFVKNESFKLGEVLQFKMTYGIFNVGEGTAQIQNDYHNLEGRECFKVEISAQTVGVVSWISDVHNQYSAFVDTASLLPLSFYRKQHEGNYKKDERTIFDHPNKKILVQTLDQPTGKWKDPIEYKAPSQVRDMISGFLHLRNMDLTKVRVKDTIVVNGFFEDKFYSLKVIYFGKAIIKTKIGKIRTLVFKPVMPDNKLFRGENSVTGFFSDDKNRIPIKIETKMFIGNAGVELTGFKGLRNSLNVMPN